MTILQMILARRRVGEKERNFWASSSGVGGMNSESSVAREGMCSESSARSWVRSQSRDPKVSVKKVVASSSVPWTQHTSWTVNRRFGDVGLLQGRQLWVCGGRSGVLHLVGQDDTGQVLGGVGR